MNCIPSEVFMLANEPVVICRGGTLRFANFAAEKLLGDDCVGCSSRELFGAEVAEAQTRTFVAGVSIDGKNHTLRVSKGEDGDIIFISGEMPHAELVNDAFLYSARAELMNINAAAELLREKLDRHCSQEEQQSLSTITRSYYALLRLVGNASAVNGISNGSLPYMPRYFDISAMCGELMYTVGELMGDAELRLNLNLGEKLMLYADPELIKLLIVNLLSNSLLHAKGLSCISMSLLNFKESVVLSVSDDGCGIRPEELGTVFQRYSHSFDLTRMSGGAGFGLSVARGIAAIHGGTLLLESRENIGTTIRVSFKKKACTPEAVHEGQPDYGELRESLLVGLADVLPCKLYSERYMD